jgi:SAM-dependent methyltransferase
MRSVIKRLMRPFLADAPASAEQGSSADAPLGQPAQLLYPFPDMPTGLRRGRDINAGYARGWGLQYGGLAETIARDGLYQQALALAAGRTLQSEANRMNLFLILTRFLGALAPGHIVEFGSYKGGSALFMAQVCKRLHPGIKVYAFDTFAGMPATDKAVDAHWQGDFAGVDLAELKDFAASQGLDNLHFVQGLFEDTTGAALLEIGAIRLNHIDCDIRSAAIHAYQATRPHMVPGGYLVFDDPLYSSCLGAFEMVEEVLVARDGLFAEQVYPHLVYRAPGAPDPQMA